MAKITKINPIKEIAGATLILSGLKISGLKEITSGDLPPAIKIKPVIMSTRAMISKIRLVCPKR